jgi:DNA-binding GntR family transcriptional regulator
MYEALKRGDADKLERLVRQHLQRTLDWCHTVIEQ